MLTPQHRKIALGLVIAVFVVAAGLVLSRKVSNQGVSYDIASGSGGMPSYSKGEMALGVTSDAYAPAPTTARMYVNTGVTSPMPPYEPSAGQTAAEVDQKIIKNGYLNLSVVKVSETATKISDMAARRKGFVQSSSITERGDGTYSGDISIRVPAAEFEASMNEIKSYAALVKNETSTGQDVTEQYTDLEAQLRNARAQEEVYLEILKQARTVDDTLKVQQQLGMIRGQIESLQGRLKYLENVTSYSTISVSLAEEPSVRAPTKEFRPFTIVKEAFQTLVTVFQSLIAGLIWVVIVWGGVLLPVALIAWLIWRAWKRRSMQVR